MAVDDHDSVEDVEDMPQITLAEMLDDLDLGSAVAGDTSQQDSNGPTVGTTNDATGVHGTPMME